ncbi:MAG: 3-oxoacyl-ACP synthase [bacterium (Candidatus Ratteibacteria) CG_4_10_14_3_um_filter_41_18]|uniref:Beta-ketoacyl-[acyl-carrier-protein] synthase III n=4 Tax=Candidatus Ratteibacteria TaxID=2979319 RepID=A0A2M7E967_9BACT|nr:MAG: 3-oxoacyl-ACP synthase [bacterium (Candidatus Ratteibacteria) CG01_land_8_20_14_3_00_40_19]PIW33051.1 MAG: 3-oxoacyl-ACP synthase [bacterium (Candidatus Ratteibacteria) CG15_BIG_FIL_POST_REV_8_21_14_020_41_12]PIX76695.1 MAG: 3-oxoacyl-ACP synthase [bacterium (Candidatus Ratteibacteria) CG_4_10_14_3_um_filter_41_18]PJA61277.1 MAG: 3-oxoacyl-ACP synthase [bacterium (Candidatus Ratteibacteria) CG_4_9_14_3_um_filter_41_21]HCG76373.1 3-oxoacyl-ACP synthase [bacterium]
MKAATIIATGSYLPEKILSNKDLEKIVETSDKWITKRTGIKQRHIAREDESASDLGIKAALSALNRGKINASEIGLIIVTTVTPDMFFPATSCIIQNKIGAHQAAAFDLNAACSGFIYGLAVADQFIKTGVYQKILLIATEAMSKVTDYTDRNTCVLLGDGAGAAIIGSTENKKGILNTWLAASGKYGNLLFVPAGGSRMPASHKTIDEHLHYMKMEGHTLFKVAIHSMIEAIEKILAPLRISPEKLDLVIPHQANLRIIKAVAKGVNLPLEKFYINVDHCGNMSSASIAVALDEARKEGRIKEGSLVLLVGFGAGLTWGSCLIRF